MADELFAGRHGFVRPKPITYRADLPPSLFKAALHILAAHTSARYVSDVCIKLFDRYQTSGRFKPLGSFETLEANLSELQWYELYSLVEYVFMGLVQDDKDTLVKLHVPLSPQPLPRMQVQQRAPPLRDGINAFFAYEGIGWELDDQGKIVSRGDENFTQALEGAINVLDGTGRATAAQHLKSSRQALSERPTPNTAGAVSHATSAVECVLHDITGEAMTLGKYVSTHPGLFHPALRKGLDGIYGYASDEGARHGKEGTVPTPEAARFVVATCSSICTLLAETNPQK